MGEVIDFAKKRKETIEQKKRQFERVFFDELIGCYSAIESEDKVIEVKVLDVSKSGCLIEVPMNSKHDQYFAIDSTVKLRLYFTKKSFIPLEARVARSEEVTSSDRGHKKVIQFGMEFDQNLACHKVLESFVSFIEQFAEYSRVDNQQLKTYFF
jgi:hypothetical protein